MVRALLIALVLSATPLKGQDFVVIDPAVRATLAAAWDTHNPGQTERAYCATYRHDQRWGVDVFRVTRIHRARTLASTDSDILYECRDDEVPLHTHPPTTCDSARCRFGGPDAYECFPSELDLASLTAPPPAPFGLIQCDRNAIIFYFPKLIRSSRRLRVTDMSTPTRKAPTMR